MHVRIRFSGKPDTIVVVQSKLTTIDEFRRIIKQKFDVQPRLQKLFYGGKLLENGYTFHDYNIKLNDVIQLMVKTQVEGSPKAKTEKTPEAENNTEKNIEYKDAVSTLYEVGDLIDMRDQELGAWFEGKITKIVQNPETNINGVNNDTLNESEEVLNITINSDADDVENKPPVNEHDSTSTENISNNKNKGIKKYFSKVPKSEKKKESEVKTDKTRKQDIDSSLLYKVKLDSDEDDNEVYCKLKDIRPRARKEIDIKDLNEGMLVMVNYNVDEPSEIGYWYDLKVTSKKKMRTSYDLIGTLYLGPDAVPQNETRIMVNNKIFAIEKVVSLAERSKKIKELMVTPTEKRAGPLKCLTCRDDDSQPCKDCGCFLCSGKDSPDKIVLCDECDNGYHMWCLAPPLTELPEEDWYCPSCRRDQKEVVAPGGSKQVKKTSKSNRDWGRGMACVGKTKTCAMPPNHFGPIPGIEVGMCWRFRIQLSETGVHRPPVSGIHGRDVEGAYSIVLSGGYEDDVDNGNEFTYTGSGGRDLSGNKRTAEQSCDQTLTRENKALARNCAVKQISEEGGDAGDDWRSGKPVRVVRSYKMLKHFPKYAPKEGIRYDGIYKVVKYYPEKGLSGYRVWKYLLRRDDPSPAPWEPEAMEYPIVYPDGYLEAEAQKKALLLEKKRNGKGISSAKNKKRAMKESNQTAESEEEAASPANVKKTSKCSDDEQETNTDSATRKRKQSSPGKSIKKLKKTVEVGLSDKEEDAIKSDTLNHKLWEECLSVCYSRGKKEFVEHVTEQFRCIICQDMVVSPVTTPCLHNFCMVCIKQSFKASGEQCPYCRQSLANYAFEPNEQLKTALRSILPGYDAGKK